MPEGVILSPERTHSPEGVNAEAGVTKGLSPNPEVARRMTKLIRVGGKLATLGVLFGATTPAQSKWWHIARPGTIGHPDPLTRMTTATSLCRRIIVTNGYASDFTPADGVLCPGCREQV